jgi:flagellar motor switch protein FliN
VPNPSPNGRPPNPLTPRRILEAWCAAFEQGLSRTLGVDAAAHAAELDEAPGRETQLSRIWLEQSLGDLAPSVSFGVAADWAHGFAAQAQMGGGLADDEALEAARNAFESASLAMAAAFGDGALSPSLLRPRPSPPAGAAFFELDIRLNQRRLPPVLVAFGGAFKPSLDALAEAAGGSQRPEAPPEPPAETRLPSRTRARSSGALDTSSLAPFLDFELPVRISLGRTSMALRDVLKLGSGAVIELNRSVEDLVEIVVNNRVVARGEIVVVEGNYGARILEVNDTARREASVGTMGEGRSGDR